MKSTNMKTRIIIVRKIKVIKIRETPKLEKEGLIIEVEEEEEELEEEQDRIT